MKPTQLQFRFGQNKIYTFDAHLSMLVWIFIFLAFPLFAVIKENIFPIYYFWDANTIETFMMRNNPLIMFDSYASTAAFFNVFNVSRDSVIFPIVSSLIIIANFYFILKKSEAEKITLLEFLVYLYCMLLSIVYMTLLSKDFVVLLFIIPFLPLSKKGVAGLIFWSLLALFYAIYFRSYWFILLGMFWFFYIALGIFRRPIVILLLGFFILFCLAVVFKVGMGIDVDNFRNIVNETRLENANENARTMIVSIIPGGGLIISWLNVCLTWVFMMVPIPLLVSFSPFYIIISFFIMLLWYKFWRSVKIEMINQGDKQLRAIIALIISFTAVQSIFEPDYGSYVRHLSPFYPLFFYALFASYRTVKEVE
ncbi:hypothetical protein ACP3TC_07270 [Winslowiella sp. 2C04]|uniref:hypothetical protein n=1 Tax=Winslowiella sp. 2C04 TaxID=3416179 RepID=UPI003CFB75D7